MKGKILLVILFLFLFSGVALAEWTMNPFTGKHDYYTSTNGSLFVNESYADDTYLRLDTSNDPIVPASDSTTAFQIMKAGGSSVIFNIDSTNRRMGVNTDAPTATLDVRATAVGSQIYRGYDNNNKLRFAVEAGSDGATDFEFRDTSGTQRAGVATDGSYFRLTNVAGSTPKGVVFGNVGTLATDVGYGEVVVKTRSGFSLGGLVVLGGADVKQVIVRGHSSQTDNLTEWQTNAGTVLASVNPTGKMDAVSYSVGGVSGWSGNFTNGDGDTVTVINGIITDVS